MIDVWWYQHLLTGLQQPEPLCVMQQYLRALDGVVAKCETVGDTSAYEELQSLIDGNVGAQTAAPCYLCLHMLCSTPLRLCHMLAEC